MDGWLARLRRKLRTRVYPASGSLKLRSVANAVLPDQISPNNIVCYTANSTNGSVRHFVAAGCRHARTNFCLVASPLINFIKVRLINAVSTVYAMFICSPFGFADRALDTVQRRICKSRRPPTCSAIQLRITKSRIAEFLWYRIRVELQDKACQQNRQLHLIFPSIQRLLSVSQQLVEITSQCYRRTRPLQNSSMTGLYFPLTIQVQQASAANIHRSSGLISQISFAIRHSMVYIAA